MNSHDRCTAERIPNTWPRSGIRAFALNGSVRRLTLWMPSCVVNFSGPLIAHATRDTAMPFIMIVVTTSCAPVFTFRIAGTSANAIPPSMPNRIAVHISNGPGRKSSFSAAHDAVTMPTRY